MLPQIRTLMLLALAASAAPQVLAAPDDLNAIRAEIEKLRSEYDAKIRDLENRLKQAQLLAQQAHGEAARARVAGQKPASVNQNPGIGVILNASLSNFSRDPEDYRISGFSLGPETGPGEDGFGLGESEITLSANIDDKFYGNLTAALAAEDGETHVELEEAYLQTLALPYGLTVRAGRFFSGIGYLNGFHGHNEDFMDRPLPYRALLANRYGDDGLQIRWLVPSDSFIELGAELMRGDAFPAGGGANSGLGAHTLFARFGGDVGASHAWGAGISRLYAKADERESGDEDAPDLFSGESRVWIADAVWKWAPQGNPAQRNFKLQAEYIRRDENGMFAPAGGTAFDYGVRQSGWYVQTVYQFMPRWRGGLRFAALDAGRRGAAFAGSALDRESHDPRHASVMIDWSNSEFGRLRLQYDQDRSSPESQHRWGLQYIMSFGAHGAHQF